MIKLTGNARQYYLDTLRSKNLSIDNLFKSIKDRFQTPERTRVLLREWDSLLLNGIMSNNPDIPQSECLEQLLARFSDIQASLLNEHRNRTILPDRLLNSVKDVSGCQLVYQKPANTAQGVISDLHASLAMCKRPSSQSLFAQPILDVSYVDRRYVRGSGCNRPGNRTGRDRKCLL